MSTPAFVFSFTGLLLRLPFVLYYGDTKANVILRHAQIALSFELSLARDDTFTPEVMIYPTLSEGSEYGLAGDLADAMIPYQIYDGVYDPTTDEVTFDEEES